MKKIISIFLSLCISISVLCGMDFKTYAVEGTDYLSQSDVDFITEKYLYMLDETTKAMHIKDLTDIDHKNSDTYWQSVSYVINKMQSDLGKISPYMPKALSESELYKIGDESIKYISAGVEILKNVDYIVNEDTNTYQQCYHGLQVIGDICSVAGIKLGPLGTVLSILSTTFIIADILNQAYVKEQLGLYEYELQIAYYTNQELPIPQASNSPIKNEYYDGACALYLKYSLMQFRDNNNNNNNDQGDLPPTEILVSSVVFDTHEYTLFYNSIVTNPATVYPSNATDKSITYYSGNTSVATVDQTGKLTVVNPGTVTIYAQASNGVTDSCNITILPYYASISNDQYTITGCVEGYTSLTIPSYVNGKPIVGIADKAFLSYKGLKSINIGNSVKSIGEFAFQNCTALTSVVIPDSVTDIGQYAFSKCSLLKSLTLPEKLTVIKEGLFWESTTLQNVYLGESIKTIERYAFKDCSALTSVIIPNSVTSIGESAFNGCTNLSSMTLPFVGGSASENTFLGYIFGAPSCHSNSTYIPTSLKKVTLSNKCKSIEDYAFYNSTHLTNITIPDSVTSIGRCAFYDCRSLNNINVDTNNSVYSSISGVLFNKEKSEILHHPQGKTTTSYIIPNSVDSIGDNAFYSCTSLTSITIPDSVTSIGASAFEGCSSLTSIVIPDSVTSIGASAFEGCSSLTSIVIPDSVTSIGSFTFIRCTSLTSIVIPDSVTSIGSSAFGGCTSLTNVTLGDGVTSIAYGAFNTCTSLTSITIPDSVTSIGTAAFQDCTSLTSIIILDSVTSIGSSAFARCTSLTNVTLGDGVTSIGKYAFSRCSSLTSITIPDSVTSIDGSAFNNCTNLTAYCNTQNVADLLETTGCKYRRFGDFDDDKKLSSTDTVLMRKSLFGEYDENYDKKVADTNQDSKFDIRDLVRLKKKLAGIIA